MVVVGAAVAVAVAVAVAAAAVAVAVAVVEGGGGRADGLQRRWHRISSASVYQHPNSRQSCHCNGAAVFCKQIWGWLVPLLDGWAHAMSVAQIRLICRPGQICMM